MTTFIGEYNAKIDDKGRVVFPSPFKALLKDDTKMIVKKDLFSPCLEIYTFEQWEEETQKLKSKLNFLNSNHARFWREYMKDCAMIQPDNKVGRITIPEKLLKSIGVVKELIFLGNGYKIEVWSKENFETSNLTQQEYIDIAQEISKI